MASESTPCQRVWGRPRHRRRRPSEGGSEAGPLPERVTPPAWRRLQVAAEAGGRVRRGRPRSATVIVASVRHARRTSPPPRRRSRAPEKSKRPRHSGRTWKPSVAPGDVAEVRPWKRWPGCGRGEGGRGAAATWAARSPQRRWPLQREAAATAVAAAGTSAGRRQGRTVTKVEHRNSSEEPAQSRKSDADIVSQPPQPPRGIPVRGGGRREAAFSAQDAQFSGNCHRTWWEVSSQYRDHSLLPQTEGQLPFRWLAINTVKSQRRGS